MGRDSLCLNHPHFFLRHEAPNGEGLQIYFQITNKPAIDISDKDNSLWMNYQSWDKELKTKSVKEKTKCTIHARAITDRLCPEIDTLNWVLNEILVLSQRSQG